MVFSIIMVVIVSLTFSLFDMVFLVFINACVVIFGMWSFFEHLKHRIRKGDLTDESVIIWKNWKARIKNPNLHELGLEAQEVKAVENDVIEALSDIAEEQVSKEVAQTVGWDPNKQPLANFLKIAAPIILEHYENNPWVQMGLELVLNSIRGNLSPESGKKLSKKWFER